MSVDSIQNREPVETFRWRPNEQPSTALLLTISNLVTEDSVISAPLYEVIDTDALDNFFAPTNAQVKPRSGRIGFEYHGYWIVLTDDRRGYIFESRGVE